MRLALSFVKLASFGPHCSTQTALRGLLGLPGLLCFALIGLFGMRWARSVVEVAYELTEILYLTCLLACLLSFGRLYLLSVHALFAWLGWSAWLSSPQF